MKYFRRSKFLNKKRVIALILISAALFAVAVTYAVNASKLLVKAALSSMKAAAGEAANDAAYSVLFSGYSYGDFVKITRDGEGNILSITTETLKMNTIARNAVAATKKNFSSISSEGVKIPLGVFTGVEALAGAGPKITVKTIPVCSVDCSFYSTLTSAGINQTKHSVYINIVSDITVVMFVRSESVTVTSEILIAESVIVGKIPSVYMES